MIEWSFEALWNDSLIPVERKPEPRDYIWASELGGSMIDRYLKMKGVEYSTPPNMRSMRKFQAGNFFEWIVSMVLKRAGLIIAQQDRVYHQYDGLLKVSGKIDFLAGGTPDYEKAKAEINVYDLPDFVKNAAMTIITNFEKNGVVEYKKMVLEIKSCSSFVYKSIEATNAPKPQHYLQCFHYLKGLNMDEGRVIYISKDDCLIKEFGVYNQPSAEGIYKKDIETITGYYNANERPPLEPLIGWENGKFTVNKAVEYSNYLEMLYGFETPEQYRARVNSTVTGANRVVKRIIDGAKMTDNNKQKIEEIKKYYTNFDDLMDEAKELAKQGKLVDDEEDEN